MEKQLPQDEVMEENLRRVQLRTESGEIILIPKPSSDPNDPLIGEFYETPTHDSSTI